MCDRVCLFKEAIGTPTFVRLSNTVSNKSLLRGVGSNIRLKAVFTPSEKEIDGALMLYFPIQ